MYDKMENFKRETELIQRIKCKLQKKIKIKLKLNKWYKMEIKHWWNGNILTEVD